MAKCTSQQHRATRAGAQAYAHGPSTQADVQIFLACCCSSAISPHGSPSCPERWQFVDLPIATILWPCRLSRTFSLPLPAGLLAIPLLRGLHFVSTGDATCGVRPISVVTNRHERANIPQWRCRAGAAFVRQLPSHLEAEALFGRRLPQIYATGPSPLDTVVFVPPSKRPAPQPEAKLLFVSNAGDGPTLPSTVLAWVRAPQQRTRRDRF